jgi:class I fructose-bisphosphate aldolase
VAEVFSDRRERIVSTVDGRSLIGTFAHGLLRGPIDREGAARDLGDAACDLSAAGLDAVVLSPGLLRMNAERLNGRARPGIVVCLEWNNMFFDLSDTGVRGEGRSGLLGSVEDALRLGADAILTYIFLGSQDADAEARHVERNAILSRECERLGVVRIIETMIRGSSLADIDQTRVRNVALGARMAAEIGCDLVKVEWPGSAEALARVVEGCPVPVLVAGGDALPPDDFLAIVQQVIAGGASGMVVGRNIVQSSRRVELVHALRTIIHGADLASSPQALLGTQELG